MSGWRTQSGAAPRIRRDRQAAVKRMSKRRPNWRLIKRHRSYTVQEAAETLGKHENTVRNWVKEGLSFIDGRRPQLLLGRELADFLRKRAQKGRCRCGPGEIYCVRCKSPKRPAGDMVEYMPIGPSAGNLRAICPDCGRLIHRRAGATGLAEMQRLMNVTFVEAERQLREGPEPCENCDE